MGKNPICKVLLKIIKDYDMRIKDTSKMAGAEDAVARLCKERATLVADYEFHGCHKGEGGVKTPTKPRECRQT